MSKPIDIGYNMALTEKMIRFCNEYLIDLNATQAAIRAGYSEDNAGAQGHENLKKPEIQQFLEIRRREIQARLELSQDWVLNRLKEVSDRSMQAIPVMKFDPVEKCMVQMRDEQDRDVWQYDSTGVNKATELIGKHLGMFVNKVDLTTKGDSLNEKRPVTILPDGTTLEI